MAPRRGESIERNDEYEEFMSKLQGYHEERRTNLDPEPKVGVRRIDLRKLYNRVVAEGGYDLCSDTKAKPLMWRRLAEEFVGKNVYTTAQAFQIKNVYYKNLCAFEIKHHWEKEPPPKEILEEVTAKGGNVMTRTLENFELPVKREDLMAQNEDASDTSPDQQTPKEEKADEEPGSVTGRSTRGLRQQPPQRVLFQPDLTSGRQARGTPQTSHGSPGPATLVNGIAPSPSLSTAASATLASYEPSQSYPLSLKPVITPANNPEFYRNERKRKLEANAGPLARKYRNIMLPGTGFIGPNIYVRAQLALQSGLPEEEQYALYHLVKISHERGDKYRFDQFPGLAEALVKKALEVSGLFYGVAWDVSYDDDQQYQDDEMLEGLRGTPDVIQKLRAREAQVTNDSLQDSTFLSQLNRITEAALIIRNMALLDENASYLAKLPLIRDYLSIILNLPNHSCIIELQHYALETAEQVLRYCDIGAEDSIYHSLLFQLDRKDRGAITLALRIISRIAMNFEHPKRLEDIPDHILQNVQDWLMVDDEELRSACLDFLMQYTSFADNVDNLFQAVDSQSLAQQLSRLLLFAAKQQNEARPQSQHEKIDGTTSVPRLSRSIVESLLKLDEPERSSEWLRMCFFLDAQSEMTQISLWQAYQATFNAFHSTHPHLIAGDFIKNVSSTFPGATAQVAGSNKYVIRGIRARKVPVESAALSSSRVSAHKGKELQKCCWKVTLPVEGQRDLLTGSMLPSRETRQVDCAEWFRGGENMLKHIISSHLKLQRKQPDSPVGEADEMDIDSAPSTNGVAEALSKSKTLGEIFDFSAADQTTLTCRWATCKRTSADFESTKAPRTVLFVRHIQTHLPDSDSSHAKHQVMPNSRSQTSDDRTILTTISDDRGDAAGLPLGAALVLRNIAKFMPRTQDSGTANVMNGALDTNRDDDKHQVGSAHETFDDEVMERLFYAMSHNKVIQHYVGSILRLLKDGGT